MATFSKLRLGDSNGGTSISIDETVAPGTYIHGTLTTADEIDEVWLYATNGSSSAVTLTVYFGGSSDKDRIILSIPAQSGLTLVVPGLILSGTGSSTRYVRAMASAAQSVYVSGYVNRIS